MSARMRSAGLLLYRRTSGATEVLIAHMGGPYWARRDEGAWSIPKGEYSDGEDPLAVALREFGEELGSPPPEGAVVALGEFIQPSGKRVTVFARQGDLDVSKVRSNEFEMEWPPGSGRMRSFPEIDRAEWMPLDRARTMLLRGQVPAVDALERRIALESEPQRPPHPDARSVSGAARGGAEGRTPRRKRRRPHGT